MDDTDRLLRESDIIRLIKERYGISACGIIEAIRDCPEANALTVNMLEENREGKSDNGTHVTGFKN